MRIPVQPPRLADLAASLASRGDAVDLLLKLAAASIGPAPEGRYRHWTVLRHLKPPDGLTHEEWWFGIKTARALLRRMLPLSDVNGIPFHYVNVDEMYRMLSEIDARGGGSIPGEGKGERDSFLLHSLMEEAITSSQLEGASTTRQVAKEMILRGRGPRTKSERMILNNYRAMEFVREVRHESLTPEIIFELHRILTEGTLDRGEAGGLLRTGADRIQVVDHRDQTVLHTPPAAGELPERLKRMCRFANAGSDREYLHPIIRSLLLHFWLAYDHPFIDGNGRTARALFYWSAASRNYRLIEFLSISSIIRRRPSKYARSFLYTETDENDTTYFILDQLDVIGRAIAELQEYLGRKSEELDRTRAMLQTSRSMRSRLNHRQIEVLNHAMRNPRFSYTIASHMTAHGVSYHTSRSDLLGLAGLGLLEQEKQGKELGFIVPRDLEERVKRM